MDEQIDISSITFEDLQEEYQKLRDRYSQLIFITEQDTQRIHELRRSLETANAAEAYLAQELEQLSSVQTLQDDTLLHKKQNEIDELRKRQSTLLAENEDLNQDIIDLRAENGRLNQKIKELTLASQPVEVSYQIPKEFQDMKERLETENLELLAKLDETHESVVKFTMSLAEKEKQIEILKDQVLCLGENLQSKREEVDEKSHLLESAQEQVVEMNAKIALLTSSPDNSDRKGNSLFAEVDDQRQAMKQLLAAQKKNYLHMKKSFNESQHEIRRLKRENVAMHNELQACSTIFCTADKTYKEKLNERILQLLKQNEDLEKKLINTQQELISLANDKGVAWLDSMLLFCKQETEELKKQLHSCRIQKGILEERLRNSQQELAKWRFEALKTRCILIDRESLLTENNIVFKFFTNKDVPLTLNDLESAKPNLGMGGNQPTMQVRTGKDNFESVDKNLESVKFIRTETSQVPVIEIKDEVIKDNDKQSLQALSEPTVIIQGETENNTQSLRAISESTIESSQSIEIPKIKVENWDVQSEGKKQEIIDGHGEAIYVKTEDLQIVEETKEIGDNEKEDRMLHSIDPLGTELSNLHIKTEPIDGKIEENKENICISLIETGSLPKCCAKTSPDQLNRKKSTEFVEDLKPIPSILVKKRNIFGDENNTKTLRFAETEKSDQSSQPKLVRKPTRTKSIIVRRVLVNTKSKNDAGSSTIRQ